VVARVVGERHAWVVLDPLELLAEAKRGGERDGALLAVAQPYRRHRGHDGATRGGQVGEGGGHITRQDLVDVVGPVDPHRCTAARRLA
jgi:hypothetical protein